MPDNNNNIPPNFKARTEAEAIRANAERQRMIAAAVAAQNEKNKDREIDLEARRMRIERMRIDIWPRERISDQWWILVRLAMRKSRPIAHQLSLEDFSGVLVSATDPDKLTFYDFGVLSNALEDVSAEDLDLTNEGYREFIITNCVPHIKFWNEKRTEWEAAFLKHIKDEVAQAQAANLPQTKLAKA